MLKYYCVSSIFLFLHSHSSPTHNYHSQLSTDIVVYSTETNLCLYYKLFLPRPVHCTNSPFLRHCCIIPAKQDVPSQASTLCSLYRLSHPTPSPYAHKTSSSFLGQYLTSTLQAPYSHITGSPFLGHYLTPTLQALPYSYPFFKSGLSSKDP